MRPAFSPLIYYPFPQYVGLFLLIVISLPILMRQHMNTKRDLEYPKPPHCNTTCYVWTYNCQKNETSMKAYGKSLPPDDIPERSCWLGMDWKTVEGVVFKDNGIVNMLLTHKKFAEKEFFNCTDCDPDWKNLTHKQ